MSSRLLGFIGFIAWIAFASCWAKPTLFLIGDSTVRNSTAGQMGWDAAMAHLKRGDFVLMQLGHNDGGKLNDDPCRASIKGIGEETENIVRIADNQPETVHSYGWYLRKLITDAKSKAATPIVVSLIPRNIWKDGKIGRSAGDYVGWASQVAHSEHALFIDFNNLLGDHYESLGEEKTAALFAGTDHTHTGPIGAA